MYTYENDFYAMEEQIVEFFEEFGPALLVGLLVLLLGILVWALVSYVLTAAGFCAVAKRRGINNPWLAWIPIANYWIIGSISDQYQYVVKGKVTNRRKVLLILQIVSGVVSGVMSGVISAVTSTLVMVSEDAAVGLTLVNLLTSFITLGISITVMVFYYMALYDYYSSCCPKSNVLLLVLGLFFSWLQPFFIFFNRKKDAGMPPRKPEPQYSAPVQPQYEIPQPVEEIPQPETVAEPWDNSESI